MYMIMVRRFPASGLSARDEDIPYYLKRSTDASKPAWSTKLNDAEFFPSSLAAAKSPHLSFPEPDKAVADFGEQANEITAGIGSLTIVIAKLGPTENTISVHAVSKNGSRF